MVTGQIPKDLPKILMVCTGNICRSPTAHGVLQTMAKKRGIPVFVESCGTTAYHVGELPDPRSMRVAHARGYDLSAIRAMAFQQSDFTDYDLILAMDKGHFRTLQSQCPPSLSYKIKMFTHVLRGDLCNSDVPDPYYGGDDGFEHVIDIIEKGCENLLNSPPFT